MGIENERHLKVRTIKGKTTKISSVDYHSSDKNRNPMNTGIKVYSIYQMNFLFIPKRIEISTPPAVRLHQALQYPYTKQWYMAQDKAEDKLDHEGVVEWSEPTPTKTKPMPLTMKQNCK